MKQGEVVLSKVIEVIRKALPGKEWEKERREIFRKMSEKFHVQIRD